MKRLIVAALSLFISACVPEVPSGTEFNLKFDQKVKLKDENFYVLFKSVEESRCPLGDSCEEEGEAAATLELTSKDEIVEKLFKFSGDSLINEERFALGYEVEVKSISPHPQSGEEFDASKYFLTVSLTRSMLSQYDSVWYLREYETSGGDQVLLAEGELGVNANWRIEFTREKVTWSNGCKQCESNYSVNGNGNMFFHEPESCIELECSIDGDWEQHNTVFENVMNDTKDVDQTEGLQILSATGETLLFTGVEKTCDVEQYFQNDDLHGQECVNECTSTVHSSAAGGESVHPACHTAAVTQECRFYCYGG